MAPRPARIPHGAWPAQMPADMAAGYVGERTADGFLRRVGSKWPYPSDVIGRERVWRRVDLDRAMGLASDPVEAVERQADEVFGCAG